MWMCYESLETIRPSGTINGDWERLAVRGAGPVLDFNPLAKASDEAIANGRLRILVSREEVRFDRLYFTVHSQHPSFKISKGE